MAYTNSAPADWYFTKRLTKRWWRCTDPARPPVLKRVDWLNGPRLVKGVHNARRLGAWAAAACLRYTAERNKTVRISYYEKCEIEGKNPPTRTPTRRVTRGIYMVTQPDALPVYLVGRIASMHSAAHYYHDIAGSHDIRVLAWCEAADYLYADWHGREYQFTEDGNQYIEVLDSLRERILDVRTMPVYGYLPVRGRRSASSHQGLGHLLALQTHQPQGIVALRLGVGRELFQFPLYPQKSKYNHRDYWDMGSAVERAVLRVSG